MAYRPIEVNLTLSANEEWPLKFTVQDASGAAQSLTGASAIWVLMSSPEGYERLRKTVGSGIVITDAAAGILVVTVEEADVDDLPAGVYYHELRASINSIARVVARGAITVLETAIRA